ncbi:hypothetical protein DPEC_G00257430 [Dallia pectoralis]|uniref:Uncharacterized protein n=1 Tax=Dallia pectoralis TaxID=75939 RepID=A0ACC2FQT4_DALPE|nr:hypothetical protein DPEC_G00257430 [Dallia pectoralis]
MCRAERRQCDNMRRKNGEQESGRCNWLCDKRKTAKAHVKSFTQIRIIGSSRRRYEPGSKPSVGVATSAGGAFWLAAIYESGRWVSLHCLAQLRSTPGGRRASVDLLMCGFWCTSRLSAGVCGPPNVWVLAYFLVG